MFFKTAFFAFTLLSLAPWAQAEEVVLNYQKQNHWVAQADIQPLRQLLTEAKKSKARHFHVKLPAENRDLSLSRLFILRDVLERSLKTGIILEEIEEEAAPNTIAISPTFPEQQNLTPAQKFSSGVPTPSLRGESLQ